MSLFRPSGLPATTSNPTSTPACRMRSLYLLCCFIVSSSSAAFRCRTTAAKSCAWKQSLSKFQCQRGMMRSSFFVSQLGSVVVSYDQDHSKNAEDPRGPTPKTATREVWVLPVRDQLKQHEGLQGGEPAAMMLLPYYTTPNRQQTFVCYDDSIVIPQHDSEDRRVQQWPQIITHSRWKSSSQVIYSNCTSQTDVSLSKPNDDHRNCIISSSITTSSTSSNSITGDNNTEDDDINNGNLEMTATSARTTITDLTNDPILLAQRNKNWVVLVDDEEAIRIAVGDFLYDCGYQVTACSDAESLLDLLSSSSSSTAFVPDVTASTNNNMMDLSMFKSRIPDVIISDIRMPGGKDGIELLTLIRADERLCRVPVILLTAKALTKDRVIGYQAGADAYLPKPFHPLELLSIVDSSIIRRQQLISSSTNENGNVGPLDEIRQDLVNIKLFMKQNSQGVVKKTNVYLTGAERDVLEWICQGYTNTEIAEVRLVSLITITKTIQKLYEKTKATTRTELVRWAFQTGYVSPKQ